MEKTVFVTNQFGAKVLYDDEGLLGKFKDSHSNIVIGDDGIRRRVGDSLWYMILEDEKLIERAKKYPGFGTMFNITSNEPVWNTLQNLKTIQDPNSPAAQAKPIQADIEAQADKKIESIKKQMAVDSRRYGLLFSTICKAGGGYLKDADPVLIAEFEQLKAKLGIEEAEAVPE